MPFDPLLLLVLALAGVVAYVMIMAVVRRRRRRNAVASADREQITSWENEGGNLPSREPATP
ncbi:MAG TPA: hypothetical protein VII68_10265 [Casimicrobiaceae bacterium]|jgi:hypothetical protein